MTGKMKALMQQMSDQVLRFAEGVRQEGGVRRVALEFPDFPVVIVIMRREEYATLGEVDSLKAPHPYKEQLMIAPACSWCGQRENAVIHAGF